MDQSPAIFLNTFLYTVCIRISAQPRISAHLEYVPILKAEKVNKRPALNKHPPHIHTHSAVLHCKAPSCLRNLGVFGMFFLTIPPDPKISCC